jgi:hypothetical protein
MTLILSNDDVEVLLPMSDCIAVLEEMYRELAHERAANAMRTDAVSTTAKPDAVYSLKLMGGVIPGLGVGAVRLNSDIISFGAERQVKLPLAAGSRYTGLVLLFSSETREPLAIFPDGMLQRMRVGAASALGDQREARSGVSGPAYGCGGRRAGLRGHGLGRTHRAGRHAESHRCAAQYRSQRGACVAAGGEKLTALGSEVAGSTPEQFADLIRRETIKWADVVRRAGIKID